MNVPKYISHLYNSGEEWFFQSNDTHCEGTATLSEKFASEFGLEEWGKILGLLHDRGKEGEGFQSYIRRSSGYDPLAYSAQSHKHSLNSAIIAHSLKQYDRLFWLSNPIAGHHRGLYDISELEKKLEAPLPDDISPRLPEITLPLPKNKLKVTDFSHIPRMLFSCLVDADRLDTERFMDVKKFTQRELGDSMSQLKAKLDLYLDKLKQAPNTQINLIRRDVQNRCLESADFLPGFYDLTVPTGGGKTIASLVWAINHAVRHHKKRIIIAIPYTSIILQTAGILKDIFGKENVIEHHSANDENDINERNIRACENWDAPIIVTTNVQFFESLFSNKPGKCRKLHSICNSVVILDEIQTLPISLLQPITDVMDTYRRLFGVSFLFTTATQPILNGHYSGTSGATFDGISNSEIHSIIPDSLNLHQALQRVKLKFIPGRLSYEEVGNQISKEKRVLCIVNTRRDALETFNALPTSSSNFHLSRFMCPAHIMKSLDKIKKILAIPGNEIRVVSTNLIEAGVDIDFPVIYRQLSGLDSLLQAAGRCNREGKMELGVARVFSLLKDGGKGLMKCAIDTMKDMLSIYPEKDWFSPEAIRLYYSRLYSRSHTFDKFNIALLLNQSSCQFEEAAKLFKLIDEEGKNIIVNFGDAEKLINRLRQFGPSKGLVRQLGQFSVTVPLRIFKELEKGGLIIQPWEGFYYIPLKDQYDLTTGLKTENNYLEQNIIL